jgi:RNase adapter protein RapZ
MTELPSVDVVVVTGLSGAGRTTALNALEDLNYYCVDNLPPPVVASTLVALLESGVQKIAFGIDVRVRAFLESAAGVIETVRATPGVSLRVLYLDASEELLAQRFNATRRPHPLTQDGAGPPKGVREGIQLERQLLAPLRGLSSIVVDTTNLTVHDLRREVLRGFSQPEEDGQHMFVRVLSFGFKFGPPQDADLLFDVRFLPNPFFIPELQGLSGRDRPVSDYVLGLADARAFLKLALPLIEFCLPRFKVEGKSYVTIAIGCTGGRHRSVALSEKIAKELSLKLGLSVEAVHRDESQAEHVATEGDGLGSPAGELSTTINSP